MLELEELELLEEDVEEEVLELVLEEELELELEELLELELELEVVALQLKFIQMLRADIPYV